jgi:hypothetical protein
MTAYPDPHAQPPEHRSTSTDRPAASCDDSPRVAGDVPITVWRLDDRDDDQPATQPGAGFASRLARRLVLTYTRHGETVIDLDSDIHLHWAATTTGRSYLAITEPAALPEPDQTRQPVSLITLRWPRHSDPSTVDRVGTLLNACRPIMTADASVIAAVRRNRPAEPGGSFADHEYALRAAAEQAGFTHVLQIVAISAPGEGDQYLYYATEAEAIQVVTKAAGTSDGQVLHIDLLVFHRQGSP